MLAFETIDLVFFIVTVWLFRDRKLKFWELFPREMTRIREREALRRSLDE